MRAAAGNAEATLAKSAGKVEWGLWRALKNPAEYKSFNYSEVRFYISHCKLAVLQVIEQEAVLPVEELVEVHQVEEQEVVLQV